MAQTLRNASTPLLVLVVDPDPDTRALYRAALGLRGWVVDCVSDGRQALAKAISLGPAAIITETRVPRLDGVELCRLLRRDPDTRDIPLLVVTGDADDSRIAAATEAGADRVLIKPALPDEIAHVIQGILSSVPAPQTVVPGDAVSRPPSGARSGSRRFQRTETTTPPSPPPELLCPRCERPLTYRKSHIGGVSAKHSEQWDQHDCPSGCGQFQYRQRTRTLRDVS